MKLNCDQVENILVDFIDEVLDLGERDAVANHLKTCASCQSSYLQQKAWLEKVSRLKTHEAAQRQPSADLNARILAAVARERAAGIKVKPVKSSWLRRRFDWKNVAVTAAALLLLVGGIQVVSRLLDQAATAPTRQETLAGQLDVIDIAGQERDSNGNETADTGDRVTAPGIASASPWKLYSGSMANMPIAGGMFAEDSTLESDFKTPPEKDEEMYAAFELFSQADAVRVLYTEGPPARIMFLLLWPQDEAKARADQLKEAFRPCIYPYSIEIIEADALTWLQNELGTDLYRQITADLDLGQGALIKVLIEE